MPFDVRHAGGDPGKTVVTDESTLVQARDRIRRWFEMRASRDNTDVIFLRFKDDSEAVFDMGIPIYPGDIHVINDVDLYQGDIFAIAAPGNTETLWWHYGH